MGAFSITGRLTPKPFALGVLALYLTGIASHTLLCGSLMVRAGVWPFLGAQTVLIWLWLLLHIGRLRDGGQGPAAAVGVALIYALSLALLLMLIAFLTSPDAGGVAVEDGSADSSATPLALLLLRVLAVPDFGVFTTILKGLIAMAFLPAAISVVFSIRTAMLGTVT